MSILKKHGDKMNLSIIPFKKLLDCLFVWLSHNISYFRERGIGMNVAVRIVMVTISISVLWFLFRRMLHSQIKESSFLMWTMPAFLLFVYGVWPEITYYVSDLTHMSYGYALVVTAPFISLLYYLAFKQMCQISALTSKVVELGSVVSLQKHEIAQLHKQIAELKGQSAPRQEPSPAVPDKQSGSVEIIVK